MTGFSAWLLQRLSGVYMAVFIVIAIAWVMMTDIDVNVWRQGFQSVWVQLGVLIFGLSLLLHAWIGLRDVVIDYIHPLGVRLLALSLVGLFLLANGFWLLSIIWGFL
ncbi:MAG TPA: succinate dehydrogenase, hydrophobic membrane anchor protein [Leucothrix sp.]|nr:succinate dehydrogenase, hydrophobic membrane anchor protein [Leucothrix sp.]